VDYVHFQWVREHVQHCIKDVREEMCELAEELGMITGSAEKERREQATLLHKLETLIESQQRIIEAQGRKLVALERLTTKPKQKEANIVDLRRRA
jgi:DNA anti-recombination protein RmuC